MGRIRQYELTINCSIFFLFCIGFCKFFLIFPQKSLLFSFLLGVNSLYMMGLLLQYWHFSQKGAIFCNTVILRMLWYFYGNSVTHWNCRGVYRQNILYCLASVHNISAYVQGKQLAFPAIVWYNMAVLNRRDWSHHSCQGHIGRQTGMIMKPVCRTA